MPEIGCVPGRRGISAIRMNPGKDGDGGKVKEKTLARNRPEEIVFIRTRATPNNIPASYRVQGEWVMEESLMTITRKLLVLESFVPLTSYLYDYNDLMRTGL